MKRLPIAGLVAGVAAACLIAGVMILTGAARAEGDAPDGATLTQGSWVLTSWSDSSDLPEADITLNLEDGHIYGVSACNNYNGPVTIEGNSFQAGLMATTMMFCEDSADAETTYLALLASVTEWNMDGDSLVLSADGAEILRFATV